MMSPIEVSSRLNPDAVMEHACGVGAILVRDGSDIPAFLTTVGGGTLLARYNDTPNVLEPAYWIWRQGGTIYCHIQGTDVAQSEGVDLYLDVLGYLYSDFPIGTGNRVHTYFSQAAQGISLSIRQAIGVPVPSWFQGIFLSGHSYGGACAILAGYWLRSYFPDAPIYVISFGAPKCFFGNVNAPDPTLIVNILNESDPVPYVPFDGSVSIAAAIIFGTGTIPAANRTLWTNPGLFYLLRNNVLAMTDSAITQAPIPPRNISIVQHLMVTYLSKLADWYDTQ
jgi:hypothetical protein